MHCPIRPIQRVEVSKMSLSALSSMAGTAAAAPVQKPAPQVAQAQVEAAPKSDAVTISPAGHAAAGGDADHDGH